MPAVCCNLLISLQSWPGNRFLPHLPLRLKHAPVAVMPWKDIELGLSSVKKRRELLLWFSSDPTQSWVYSECWKLRFIQAPKGVRVAAWFARDILNLQNLTRLKFWGWLSSSTWIFVFPAVSLKKSHISLRLPDYQPWQRRGPALVCHQCPMNGWVSHKAEDETQALAEPCQFLQMSIYPSIHPSISPVDAVNQQPTIAVN